MNESTWLRLLLLDNIHVRVNQRSPTSMVGLHPIVHLLLKQHHAVANQ